ncbi:hypothetical protein Q1M63_28025 [Sinorhizobium meliloti]|nr:hypothetical protein Q1M63_28025 [Sinorhizobium meliloti]
MAQAVGSIAVKAGHQVMLSNSRGPKRSGVSAIGCEVGTVDDVAAFGEMLIAPIHLQLSSANPATPLKKKGCAEPAELLPASWSSAGTGQR